MGHYFIWDRNWVVESGHPKKTPANPPEKTRAQTAKVFLASPPLQRRPAAHLRPARGRRLGELQRRSGAVLVAEGVRDHAQVRRAVYMHGRAGRVSLVLKEGLPLGIQQDQRV